MTKGLENMVYEERLKELYWFREDRMKGVCDNSVQICKILL